MPSSSYKVYCDTSVFDGVLDEEFSRAIKRFLSLVREGVFDIVISAVVDRGNP